MARGNWRSGKDHGPAEVGSHRKVVDGYVMKKSNSFATFSEAENHAKYLESQWGLKASVIENRIKQFVVYRTLRRDQIPYSDVPVFDIKTGERL